MSIHVFCIPGGARTHDPLIKSQLLYQLSYGYIPLFFAGAIIVQAESRSQIYLNYAEVQPIFANRVQSYKKKSKLPNITFSVTINNNNNPKIILHNPKKNRIFACYIINKNIIHINIFLLYVNTERFVILPPRYAAGITKHM